MKRILIVSQFHLWSIFKAGMETCGVVLQRIETGGTGQGVFDINMLHDGREVWVELKYNKDHLSAHQRAWAMRRIRAGGRIAVLMANEDVLYLWQGLNAIHDYPDNPQHVFKQPYSWEQLFANIFSPRG